MAKPEKVIPDKCINFETPSVKGEVTQKDAMLYALGVGFSQDPMNEQDLAFTYELNDNFQVFPTLATCFQFQINVFEVLCECPGLPKFNAMMLLHGEQQLQMFKPLQAGMKTQSTGKIVNIADKGKGALLTFEIFTQEVGENNKLEPLCANRMGLFIRGLGGFGFKGNPGYALSAKPKTAPQKSVQDKTVPNQAIIYRLSGDYNPLHIDPNMASMGGFDRPILHGLCFYGIAARVVIQQFCENNSAQLKNIFARFTSSVFPGETLKFDLWKNGNKVFFSGSTIERKNEFIVGEVELAPEAKL